MCRNVSFGYKSFTRALQSVDKGIVPSPEKEGFNILQKKEKYRNFENTFCNIGLKYGVLKEFFLKEEGQRTARCLMLSNTKKKKKKPPTFCFQLRL